MASAGNASVRPLARPLGAAGEEATPGTRGEDAAVDRTDLRERGVEPEHLRRALPQGSRHQGAPGRDGMTVDALGASLQTHGPTIRAAWRAGTYAPPPVRRTAIPKPGGGTRPRGIPGVLGRGIAQALVPGRPEEGDPTLSEGSDGCRPQRSAHPAGEEAQAYSRAGDTGVVARALEQCLDRVNHDGWRSRVRRRGPERRGLTLLHRFRKAGVRTLEGGVEPTAAGSPPGHTHEAKH